MARAYDGTNLHTATIGHLGSSAGPFTVAGWIKPADLTTDQYVLQTGTTPHWGVILGYVSNKLEFFASTFTGTDPRTGSDIDVSGSVAATSGVFWAFRYKGAGLEWSKWKNGAKTVISAGITFALPAATGSTRLGASDAGANFYGSLAEVAIWQVALADEQLIELAAGVAADAVATGGLLSYWPLRGNSSPELNYSPASPTYVMAPTNVPAADTHPTIVPPKVPRGPVEPAWVVDLIHPTLGTIRAASRDLGQDEFDADTLGAFYPGTLVDDIRLIDELPEGGAGVMVPANTVLSLLNTRGTFTHAQEWRNVPVLVRYYDRVSHALTVEFSGVVTDKNFQGNRAVFPCSNMDASVLSQLVPRAVIEATAGTTGIVDATDGGLQRTDVGSPIPVPHGVGGLVNPPFIAYSAATGSAALNGQDMLVGWGGDTVVRKVWFDFDSYTPGLELATLWDGAPGSPTYVSGTTFTVSGSTLDKWYYAGLSVRRSGDGGTHWKYSHVASTNINTTLGGTVILTSSALESPLGTVQIASDYSVDATQYQYIGTGGTTALTSIRFYGNTQSAILAEVGETARSNPAGAAYLLLSDPDYGLGEQADAVSFFTAGQVFTAAGLGNAVRGVLGGDRVQRPARDVLNEWCSYRGGRIWKDASSNKWVMSVDASPVDSGLTFSFGETTTASTSAGNVAEVISVTTTPLEQSVSTLKLRYHPNGRDRGNKTLEQTDYAYSAIATAHGIGAQRIIVNPWLRADPDPSSNAHLEAATVLYYQARTLATQDRQVVFKCRHQGRRLQLGQLCDLQLRTAPGVDLTGTYRVMKRERTLSDFTFLVAGPYTIDVHNTEESTILSYVAVPSADINPDERESRMASDANLILNSDFTPGLRTTPTIPVSDTGIVPGWLFDSVGVITNIAVVRDNSAKGGAYLDITVNDQIQCLTEFGYYKGVSVAPNTNYILSGYVNASGGTGTGWSFLILWQTSNGTPIELIAARTRIVPGDVNGLGFKRYYAVVSAPSNAGFASVGWVLHGTNPGDRYKFDAMQFEEVTRLSARPTPWKRNPQFGVHPVMILPGEQIVRAENEVEHGTKVSVPVFPAVGLSGAGTVTVGTTAVGFMTGLTGRVQSAITGATAFYLAANYGGGTILRLTDNIGTALATRFGDANVTVGLPMAFIVQTPLVAIAVGGTAFTGGTVRVGTHFQQHVAPTE